KDGRMTICSSCEKLAEDRIDRREVLERLSRAQRDDGDVPARAFECARQDARVRRQSAVRQDEAPPGAVARNPGRDALDDIPADANVVATRPEIEVNRLHAILARISSAIRSALRSPVSMVTCASS